MRTYLTTVEGKCVLQKYVSQVLLYVRLKTTNINILKSIELENAFKKNYKTKKIKNTKKNYEINITCSNPLDAIDMLACCVQKVTSLRETSRGGRERIYVQNPNLPGHWIVWQLAEIFATRRFNAAIPSISRAGEMCKQRLRMGFKRFTY